MEQPVGDEPLGQSRVERTGPGLIYPVEPSPLVRQVHGTTLNETDTHYIVALDLGAYSAEWWVSYHEPFTFERKGHWAIHEFVRIKDRSWWGDDELLHFFVEGR